MTSRRRIAIAAGGTAGHVTTGLAIASAYRQAFPDVSIVFVGTAEGLESQLVPAYGYDLRLVRGSPMAGRSLAGKARAGIDLLAGFAEARRLLQAEGTRLVFGLGGYASAGVLLAARSLGILIAIHESNVVPGITNRVLGLLGERIYLGFGETLGAFGEGRGIVTGTPLRPEIGDASDREPLRSARPARILVTGGSRGSSFLNAALPALLQRVQQSGIPLSVRHQSGRFDPAPTAAAYADAGIEAAVEPFIEDMGGAYRFADFAIASAGALTLAELAIAGLPALLVPLRGAASDHQTANAMAFASATGALWASEQEWDAGRLAEHIVATLRASDAWSLASKRIRSFARPEAARSLVGDCEVMMTGAW